jgi:hypothetical protein
MFLKILFLVDGYMPSIQNEPIHSDLHKIRGWGWGCFVIKTPLNHLKSFSFRKKYIEIFLGKIFLLIRFWQKPWKFKIPSSKVLLSWTAYRNR